MAATEPILPALTMPLSDAKVEQMDLRDEVANNQIESFTRSRRNSLSITLSRQACPSAARINNGFDPLPYLFSHS